MYNMAKCIILFTALGMKDNSSEINEILKYVEQNFSDVLLSKGVITKLELIGKGIFTVIQTT